MSNILAIHSEEIEMRPADAASGVAEEPQNKRLNWFQRWRMGFSNLVHRMDTNVGRSPVGRFFRLKGSGHVSSSSWQRNSTGGRGGQNVADTETLPAQGNS